MTWVVGLDLGIEFSNDLASADLFDVSTGASLQQNSLSLHWPWVTIAKL